jgi:hypothetical protein
MIAQDVVVTMSKKKMVDIPAKAVTINGKINRNNNFRKSSITEHCSVF